MGISVAVPKPIPARMRRARVAKNNSLPELRDGGGKVGGVGGQPQGLVFADGVLHAVVCVPGLLALGPGELRLETLQQVVETPGQDHDVVDVQERHDDEGRVSDACEAEGAKRGDRFNNKNLPDQLENVTLYINTDILVFNTSSLRGFMTVNML